MNMRKRISHIAVVLATVLVAGCADSGGEFKKADPDGYAACKAISDGHEAETVEEAIYHGIILAGEHATKSVTPEIQETVDDSMDYEELGLPPMVDSEKLIPICEENGVKIADVQEKSAD